MSATTIGPDAAGPVPNELIAADKVSGTSVYDTAGESLGTIEDVMIDKRSGRVAYAVMSFGGFLGIGETYHPLPWSALRYDTDRGGYVVDLDRAALEGAPSFASGAEVDWGDRGFGQRVHDYYKARPYWDSAI